MMGRTVLDDATVDEEAAEGRGGGAASSLDIRATPDAKTRRGESRRQSLTESTKLHDACPDPD